MLDASKVIQVLLKQIRKLHSNFENNYYLKLKETNQEIEDAQAEKFEE